MRLMYFAAARDLVGVSEELLDLSDVINSGGEFREEVPLLLLLECLFKRHLGLKNIWERSLTSINTSVVENIEISMVKDGDEIAIIPPVSGG